MKAVLDQVWSKLENALIDSKSAFRIMVLATSDNTDSVGQRSVVLRAIERERALIFYTDQRSDKLKVIKENDQVSLLFYDHGEQLQIACKGRAQIHNVDSSEISNYNLRSTKDYSTSLPPGSAIASPEGVNYNQDKLHLAKVNVVLSDIAYLKLGKEHHVRVLFKKMGGLWEGQYLVP